jgi:hypothetical protein
MESETEVDSLIVHASFRVYSMSHFDNCMHRGKVIFYAE